MEDLSFADLVYIQNALLFQIERSTKAHETADISSMDGKALRERDNEAWHNSQRKELVSRVSDTINELVDRSEQ